MEKWYSNDDEDDDDKEGVSKEKQKRICVDGRDWIVCGWKGSEGIYQILNGAV